MRRKLLFSILAIFCQRNKKIGCMDEGADDPVPGSRRGADVQHVVRFDPDLVPGTMTLDEAGQDHGDLLSARAQLEDLGVTVIVMPGQV